MAPSARADGNHWIPQIEIGKGGGPRGDQFWRRRTISADVASAIGCHVFRPRWIELAPLNVWWSWEVACVCPCM